MEYEKRKKKIQKSHNCPFLLGVNQQARSNPDGTLYWYINSPMGVNTITSLLKNALEGAGVDLRNQKITASSSRKNLVQAGADSQVPGHWLSKYMGHKNVNSKLEYLTNQEKTYEACSLAINRRISGRKVNFIDVTISLEKDQVQQKSPITNHQFQFQPSRKTAQSNPRYQYQSKSPQPQFMQQIPSSMLQVPPSMQQQLQSSPRPSHQAKGHPPLRSSSNVLLSREGSQT